MWKVVWKVCFPLALYQSLNQLFKILDTMMAAHISANAVSTVAYLSQIQMSIISQSALLVAAVMFMNKKDNAFGFSFKAITWKQEVVSPMVKLSIPVIVEKMAFSLGKVIVNSMSTIYGEQTVGALGISNSMAGIITNPQNGFQEGGSAVISQNLGAGKKKRALKSFYCVLIINIIISTVMMAASLLWLQQIACVFVPHPGTVVATALYKPGKCKCRYCNGGQQYFDRHSGSSYCNH